MCICKLFWWLHSCRQSAFDLQARLAKLFQGVPSFCLAFNLTQDACLKRPASSAAKRPTSSSRDGRVKKRPASNSIERAQASAGSSIADGGVNKRPASNMSERAPARAGGGSSSSGDPVPRPRRRTKGRRVMNSASAKRKAKAKGEAAKLDFNFTPQQLAKIKSLLKLGVL